MEKEMGRASIVSKEDLGVPQADCLMMPDIRCRSRQPLMNTAASPAGMAVGLAAFR